MSALRALFGGPERDFRKDKELMFDGAHEDLEEVEVGDIVNYWVKFPGEKMRACNAVVLQLMGRAGAKVRATVSARGKTWESVLTTAWGRHPGGITAIGKSSKGQGID
jgi:hypothetical protein